MGLTFKNVSIQIICGYVTVQVRSITHRELSVIYFFGFLPHRHTIPRIWFGLLAKRPTQQFFSRVWTEQTLYKCLYCGKLNVSCSRALHGVGRYRKQNIWPWSHVFYQVATALPKQRITDYNSVQMHHVSRLRGRVGEIAGL